MMNCTNYIEGFCSLDEELCTIAPDQTDTCPTYHSDNYCGCGCGADLHLEACFRDAEEEECLCCGEIFYAEELDSFCLCPNCEGEY